MNPFFPSKNNKTQNVLNSPKGFLLHYKLTKHLKCKKGEINPQLCKHYEEATIINLPNPHTHMHTQHLGFGKYKTRLTSY